MRRRRVKKKMKMERMVVARRKKMQKARIVKRKRKRGRQRRMRSQPTQFPKRPGRKSLRSGKARNRNMVDIAHAAWGGTAEPTARVDVAAARTTVAALVTGRLEGL